MRVLKVSLVAVAAAIGMTMWANRSFWVDAYSGEREPTDLTIEALDLSFRADSSGRSPFQLEQSPNTRHVQLPAVGLESAPAEQVTVQGGDAVLSGLVNGPLGPLQGAEVVIQRFTSDGAAVVHTQTNAEGRWKVRNVNGGRFRVRSFMPGQFGSSGSEVFFLEDGEHRNHNVNLAGPSDIPIVRGIPFAEAFVGGQGTAIVFVANRIIDDLGKTQQTPSQGVDVTLLVDDLSMVLTSSPTAITDAQGYATFSFSCTAGNSGKAVAQINDRAFSVSITACQVPEPVEPVEPIEPVEEEDPAE